MHVDGAVEMLLNIQQSWKLKTSCFNKIAFFIS